MDLSSFTCVSDDLSLSSYLAFREEVKKNMPHPEWLGDFSLEDLKSLLLNGSKIWVYYDGGQPVCSMMYLPADSHSLESFDLSYSPLEVADYGPMFVHPLYVGKGLQMQMFQVLDQYAMQRGCRYAACTVHPDNTYSLHNILKHGFQFQARKTFHRGERAIYVKELKG